MSHDKIPPNSAGTSHSNLVQLHTVFSSHDRRHIADTSSYPTGAILWLQSSPSRLINNSSFSASYLKLTKFATARQFLAHDWDPHISLSSLLASNTFCQMWSPVVATGTSKCCHVMRIQKIMYKIEYNALWHNILRRNTILNDNIVLYYHCILLKNIVLYWILYCVVLYCVVLCCIILLSNYKNTI